VLDRPSTASCLFMVRGDAAAFQSVAYLIG
jgi:hypothetical protein